MHESQVLKILMSKSDQFLECYCRELVLQVNMIRIYSLDASTVF